MSQAVYEVETKRTIKIEGITYKLPEWAKYVTRDDHAGGFFGWERKPEWTRDHGYYRDGGQRGRLEIVHTEVVVGDGRFFAEI